MNKEYFTDNISDETLAKLIDEALNYETTKKNKNIKLDLLKIIPAVAMVAIVVGFINILSYFSMVDDGNDGNDENAHSAVTATTEEPANPTEATTEEEVVDKYAHVRFGETRDILLLDVEWHTYDTYLELLEENKKLYPELLDEELILRHEENLKRISENKLYVAKTVNGTSDESLVLSGGMRRIEISDYLDSDGYYIQKVYPFMPTVEYIDENGEEQFKIFNSGYYGSEPGGVGSRRWYDLMLEEQIIPFCNKLLEKGQITHEKYIKYITFDPLEYYTNLYFGHLK